MFNGEAERQQASTCRTFESIAVGIWLRDKLLLLVSKIKGRFFFFNTGTGANRAYLLVHLEILSFVILLESWRLLLPSKPVVRNDVKVSVCQSVSKSITVILTIFENCV